ncbi:DUF3152 domain-containing protein [Actinacidiphila alni]|uniref:DUF3152 domain-containing protein n=1 Tax=Actinacidiphila alni TaxID=380248 RepID=UPI001FEAC752|nr:DUF3152 domain-containing protein [Actinacidiphila alni]
MGKHSARDGQDGRDNGIPGAPGVPGGPGPLRPGTPGSGRRRRGGPLAGHDTGGFAHYRPQDHGAPPPAHPEHREHGAWGTDAAWSPDAGRYAGPPRTRDLPVDLVEEWAEDWAEYDTAAALRPPSAGPGAGPYARHAQAQGLGQMQGPGRVIPRPRQEFVDAFGPQQPAAPAGGTDDADGPAGPPPGRLVGVPDTGPGPDGDGPADGKDGKDGKGGGKGRTLSGVAAAAVVTVLAVVVAGQVTGSDKRHSGDAGKDAGTRSSADEASRSQDRATTGPTLPAAAPTVTATAPTYDDLMARLYPLDPGLKLSGAFTTVGGHQPAPGRGKVMRFRVDVEKGLPLDALMFSETVFKTLNDSRSWGHGGTMSFERVSTGPADIVITLASPGTTAKWCAKDGLDTTVDNVSCDAASTPRTMINAYRWAQGAATYGAARIHEYRQMLINHEVGHRLGHGHVGCPKAGAPAPVMMQQTKFLSLDGGPACKPNAWPFP